MDRRDAQKRGKVIKISERDSLKIIYPDYMENRTKEGRENMDKSKNDDKK